MKFSLSILGLAAGAMAFPSYLGDPAAMQKIEEAVKVNPALADMKRELKVFPPVVPGRKLIPDKAHPFKAPGPNDQRGPCPGLNVMANHGYLDRSGITSSQELAWAMQEALGLGPDLAEFLGVLAISLDGNALLDRVSIGGSDSRVPALNGGSVPGGIGRHNAYEIDSSLTRDDKYFGNNFVMNGTLYEEMFQVADKVNKGALNIESQGIHRNNRYMDSKARNPEFQFVPVGVLFFGADHFPWRTLVSTGPDGKNEPATREALSYTYGAKSVGKGKWQYVPERFPAEWYRSAAPYSLAEIVSHAAISLVYASSHGAALPTGFDPARASDVNYVACNMLKVTTAQIPTTVLALPLVSDLMAKTTKNFAQFGC